MDGKLQRKRAGGDEQLDTIFHALSHRTRRALLRRLASGPAMVTELAEPFAMTRIAVTKHLRVLESAGLVSRTVEGRVHRCSMDARPLREAERWLDEYRAFWTDKLESLARFAEGDPSARTRRGK